jgi:hypothetical protein
MAETKVNQAGAERGDRPEAQDPTRDNQEHELQAEEESAQAMDSDVPQPPDASQTTEGQPS